MEQKLTCFSLIKGGTVDRATGVIRNVSVITEGDAKGHGFKIDSTSISQLFALAKGFANGVLVKLKHKQGGEFQDVIGETTGSLENFRIDGAQLKADFILLSSLPQLFKEKVCELAERFYDQFGFSPTAGITLEEKDGSKFARFISLQSVDLTDQPAANVSLFSAGCDFCGKAGCMSDHGETELSEAYDKGDDNRKLSVEKYAKEHGKKLSKKSTCMSEITPAAFEALQTLVKDLKTQLEAKSTATAITFTGDDGKVVNMSAKDVFTQLSAANNAVADATTEKENAERKVVLSTMANEGRVAINPDSKVAFTLVELEAKPLDQLKFIAANSQRIPLQAKAIFKGSEKPASGVEIPKDAKPEDRIRMSLGNLFGGAQTAQEITAALARGTIAAN